MTTISSRKSLKLPATPVSGIYATFQADFAKAATDFAIVAADFAMVAADFAIVALATTAELAADG